jgi:hypothetical protein
MSFGDVIGDESEEEETQTVGYKKGEQSCEAELDCELH